MPVTIHRKTSKPRNSAQTCLRYYLHKRLAHTQAGRSYSTIHASDVTNQSYEFCPREYALSDSSEGMKRPSQFIGAALAATFELGWDIQHLVTGWLTEIAVGVWQCRHCGEKTEFGLSPACCVCGENGFSYIEHTAVSDEYGITGSIDLLVKYPEEDRIQMVEIKSMDKDRFKKLVGPLGEHRLRTALYLWLLDQDEPTKSLGIDTSHARILYMMKGYGVKDTALSSMGLRDSGYSPFKEYIIKREDCLLESSLQKALALQQYRDDKGPLPDRVCSTVLCSRAHGCPAARACFPSSLL